MMTNVPHDSSCHTHLGYDRDRFQLVEDALAPLGRLASPAPLEPRALEVGLGVGGVPEKPVQPLRAVGRPRRGKCRSDGDVVLCHKFEIREWEGGESACALAAMSMRTSVLACRRAGVHAFASLKHKHVLV